jgi:hypothetical protein
MNGLHYPIVFRENAAELHDAIRQAKRSIAIAIRVLQTCPPPDTFLGRRHHEFIPLSDQEVVQ